MRLTINQLRQQLVDHINVPLFRNSYALILSAGSTAALGILYWIIAARLYPDKIVGINSSIFSVITLLSGLSLFNLRGLVISHLPRIGDNARRFVLSVYLVVAGAAVVITSLYVLFARLFSVELAEVVQSPNFWIWLIGTTVIWNIFIMQDHVLTGLRRTVLIPVENTIFSIFKLALLVLFTKLMPSFGIFSSWGLAMLITVLVINFLIFSRYLPAHIKLNSGNQYQLGISYVFRFVITDYIGALFVLGSTTLLPILVTTMLGTTANAYFYIPWTISNSLALVGLGISASLTVESAFDQTKLIEYTKKTVRNTLIVVLPIIVGVIIFAPLFLSFFGDRYVRESSQLIQLLAVAIIPNILIAISTGIARVQGKLVYMLAPSLFVSVVTLLTTYLLLPKIGIIAIGIALLISQFMALILLAYSNSLFGDVLLSMLRLKK